MIGRVFDVSIRHRSGESVVACTGELDMSSSARLEEAFALCIEQAPPSIAIDCSRVSFIDSSGIRALIDIAKRCSEGSIALSVAASDSVRKIADVLGVTGLIGITEDDSKVPSLPEATTT